MILAAASRAACIFSLTINSASRRALRSQRISFIIRSAMTPLASNASNSKELTITCPSKQPRRERGNGSAMPPRHGSGIEKVNRVSSGVDVTARVPPWAFAIWDVM